MGQGLMVYITLQILVPIYMRQSQQQQLSVGSRNALLAAEAFIIPFTNIFQFIEDVVLIRVNYALAGNNKALTNHLVHVGIVSSLAMGCVAAIIGTILGVIPPVLNALTNPGEEHDKMLYPGCDLIEESEPVTEYWLVEMWSVPGTDLGLVLSGFMMGALELPTVGWLGSISIAMRPLIWFTTVSSQPMETRLTLLAISEFASAWVFPILSILYMVSPLGKDLRRNTGVSLDPRRLKNLLLLNNLTADNDTMQNESADVIQMQETGGEDKVHISDSPDGNANVENIEQHEVKHNPRNIQDIESLEPNNKELLLDGIKIMSMDVAVQFCTSLGVYLALLSNASEAYQLTALQSALPNYGIAYALGLGVMFKITAPHIIADQNYQKFANLARITVAAAVLLVPIIIGSVVPFTVGLSFDYGENACEYAKDNACVGFFTHVFGKNGTLGTWTLPYTFNAFAAGASIDALFFVLRAVLLTCMDLNYMMLSTLVAIIAYVPAIAMAVKVYPFGGHAIAFFVAMYFPQAILCILFAVRIEINIRKMMNGANGPWGRKSITGSINSRS
jgi:hypothetical protein